MMREFQIEDEHKSEDECEEEELEHPYNFTSLTDLLEIKKLI